MTERDDSGFPVTDLVSKGDTPHPQERIDGKLTCETLWCADSNKGDYHKNMTSDLFMKWLNTKLIPVFKRLYPNKKMILVADNAAYHHKREIGTLSGLKKKDLVLLMAQYNVQYIDIPLTPRRLAHFEDEEPDNVTDMGEFFRIEFDLDTFSKRTTDPFLPTVEELQVGFASYLRDFQPSALECKVEKALKQEGYDVLWTPPYTPDLQPIEIYWAIGKNRVAANYSTGRTMKESASIKGRMVRKRSSRWCQRRWHQTGQLFGSLQEGTWNGKQKVYSTLPTALRYSRDTRGDSRASNGNGSISNRSHCG